MKNIAAIIVAFALIPAISAASQDADAMNAGATAKTSASMAGSQVYVVKGDVYITHGDNPAHRVAGTETIVSNTLVNTGENSSALLKFEDGQIVTMQSSSTFLVREYSYDAKRVANSKIVFSMLKGGMRFITGLIGKLRKQSFRLSTPNSTIGIRGTEFMVAMANNSMYGQVLKGKITMTNAAGKKFVGAGKSAVVASPKVLASLVPASAIPAGTFSELLAIPVDPSAISAPAPAPEAAVAAPEMPAEVGATAVGAMPGMTDTGVESTQAETPAANVNPEVPSEPAKQPEKKEMLSGSSGVGVTGKVGSLGYGAELNVSFSDSFGARLGYNYLVYRHSTTLGSVDYNSRLRLRNITILGDWYPFEGGFRTSGGLVYNDNQVKLHGVSASGNYVINGNSYTLSSLQGAVSFTNIAPYFGMGWGNPVQNGKGWGIVTDIGVLYQGSPKIDLTATCTSGCGALPNDLAAESNRLESDLNHYKWWPVVSIGVSYQW